MSIPRLQLLTEHGLPDVSVIVPRQWNVVTLTAPGHRHGRRPVRVRTATAAPSTAQRQPAELRRTGERGMGSR